ncbi:MAG: hypothetical protein AUJ55_05830 [Proteobacteria bacterium CG1_02_64_396]|nr:MAG: hypothetical protein AUJ55_05830 [Proteobacteria bacterium CG1_02_64_396]
MKLAINLLVVMAIASVIGTVLQQNQPFADYRDQFGPFWFEVLRALSMFDMYHSWWFLGILIFLVISVTTCLWRNTPRMIRDMRRHRVVIADKSLKNHHFRQVYRTAESREGLLDLAQSTLSGRGWHFQREDAGEATYLLAQKGRLNRVGYIFTHLAILVICFGGLLGGNIPLQLKVLTGQIEPQDEMNWEDNTAFRGSISIPEGDSVQYLYLPFGDSYLVQKLPFEVRCDAFDIEFWETGAPKSFKSDLVILEDGKEVKRQTIEVNKPLTYRGVTIYQSSFGDSGSIIRFKAYRVDGSEDLLEAQVHGRIMDDKSGWSIEVTDFRQYNVQNFSDNPVAPEFQDVGPSVEFVLRDGQGAWKYRIYQNYQNLIERWDDANRQWSFVNLATNPEFMRAYPAPFLLSIDHWEQKRYTGLQMTRDPGVWLVWVGSALLVFGMGVMFYMPHRLVRIVVRPSEEAGEHEVYLVGTTQKNVIDFAQQFYVLGQRLTEALGKPVEEGHPMELLKGRAHQA